ncbi:MAG TPA: sigma-70 family RNA polymerase sigma factor [Steroidobacteraceae bacterium]|nr:sigma-70 family RNA polymerase sigma factor [Steroidobacteraceae bacterium]
MEGNPVSLPAAAGNLSDPSAPAGDGAAGPGLLESALARARRGELAAFRELIRAHQDSVYSLALRMLKVPEDAEELAQDVFVSLYRHLGKIASAAHLLFWLRRTVCHRAIDRLRRRPSHVPLPLDGAEELAQPDSSRDPLLERHLRDRVLQLSPLPRAVILLRYQEDLDPPEIAHVLGMPLNTVKSHLKRSLALLRSGCDELREPISAGNPS